MKICPACSREYGDDVEVCREDAVSLVQLETGALGAAQDLVGQVIHGRYRIERIVGRGGMGTVYACRQVIVGKAFAMKVLRNGIERSEEVLQRFVREAQAANAVQSRHICEMMDFGQMPNGSFYVVMELLDGMSLTRVLREHTLSRADLKHIFVQICETLQKAHDQKIVHRDMKPDNVVLVKDENDPYFVKLVDFGIAKIMQKDVSDLTETGMILGTPYYMSPEQARGDVLDHRSDIYAIGVMMYRAFTGKLPFIADTAMGVLTRHLTELPQLPSQLIEMDHATERLILRCLEKRPIDRYQTMSDVAAAIRSIPDELRSNRVIGDNLSSQATPRARLVTPTRIDTPLAREGALGPLSGAPFALRPEDREPKSEDPTPLVVSRSSHASMPASHSPFGTAPAEFSGRPEPRLSFPSLTEPSAPLPGHPDPRRPLPSVPESRAPQAMSLGPAGAASGNYPPSSHAPFEFSGRYSSIPSVNAYGIGSSSDEAATSGAGAPVPAFIEAALPPHLQGEIHTHRGLVSTRLAAKRTDRASRWALRIGAATFLLVGIGIGIVAFGEARVRPTEPDRAGTKGPYLTPTQAHAEPRAEAVLPLISATASRNDADATTAAPSATAASSAALAAAAASSRFPSPTGSSSTPARVFSGGKTAPTTPSGQDIRSPFE